MSSKGIFLSLTLGALMVGSAAAQDPNTWGAGPGKFDPNHPRVNQVNRREQAQQRRIGHGARTGQLTPREASKLEKKEQHLVRNQRRDMAKDGGHLTAKDQAKLNREANHVSRDIYKDKHNGAVR